jgi:hypothetical protein
VTEPEQPSEATDEAPADAEADTGPGVTGEPRVDQALARLRDVDGAPLADHVAAYDEVHRLLQDALVDLDGE